MEHSIEITPINDQIPLLQTKKDEIDEGSKMDHLIEIKETNGQDPSGLQTNKSVNQIFDERFKKLDKYSSIESTPIFKVSAGLSESNPDAYKPKLISIGPYHKHNPNLRSMENYKLRYLQRFLKRKGGMDVESCISEMDKLKDDALKCYANREDLGSDITANFSQMLLLDGCFVVEFIREDCGVLPLEDMIIKTSCIHAQVCQDLVLVENQLPFFVLTKLHDMTIDEVEKSFTETVVISRLVRWKINPASFLETKGHEEDIKHLVHVVHMSCKPLGTKDMPSNEDHGARHKVMPNATELSEAGVSFEKVDKFGDSTSIFDIKFENGAMKIPLFEVFDNTESFLRNLIAYEQQYLIAYQQRSGEVSHAYFSDFAVFMDDLIDSNKDVSLLRQKGIIKNQIGEDKNVASLFNKIGKGVTISDNFYYEEQCRKAIQHCEQPWNRMKANLRHNYFNSPWAGISTVAAIILLLLTLTQTVLSFISTCKESS